MKPKIEIFPGEGVDFDHYVRVRAANGETLCVSEGYDNKANARRAAKRLKAVVAKATIEEVEA